MLYLLEVNPNHRSGRGRWWGPNRQGYTDKVENAGLYTEDQLNERDCTPRTVASVLEELEAPARALRARVGRAPEDVLNNPEPGDRVEWQDGEVWTVTGRDTQILHDVTPPDGGGRTYGDRMGLDIWADPMDEGGGSPFTCVPHP